MDYEKIPEVAVLSSVFFVASLIHVPIGPGSVHLILPGVCGLLLGWMAFPAIFIGLTLQAVLFQYGGLTTLGVNTFAMAMPATLVGLALRRPANSESSGVRMTAQFVCGAASILLSGLLMALALILTNQAFEWAALTVALAHGPVMIMEGFITMFVLEFLRKVRPEMIPANGLRTG
jgi:cobalt/nickel transport system permease protein